MRDLRMRVRLAAALLVCMLLAGCEEMETSSGGETGTSVTVLEYEPFLESSEETVAISARFQDENGEALQEG